jgi:hypothetical protein
MAADHPVPRPARDLTEAEVQARGERAWALNEAVKQALADVRKAWPKLAKALYEFNEDKAWLWLEAEPLTLGEWLADADIGLRRTQYFLMVGLWEKLYVYRAIPVETLEELEPTKAAEVLPAIEAGKLIEDAFADAKTLGYRDLREKYRYAKDGDEPDELDQTLNQDLSKSPDVRTNSQSVV